jgi:hypothetical protein
MDEQYRISLVEKAIALVKDIEDGRIADVVAILEAVRRQRELDDMEIKLSKEVRSYLEWSWNYSIAESMEQESTKGIARWIAYGVYRGEDQADQALICDWLETRVKDLEILELYDQENWEWGGRDTATFIVELRSLPYFDDCVQEVMEARAESLWD